MRLLCNQQNLDAGEALILSEVLDGLQYLCRSWQERIRQHLWLHGNPLAGLLSFPIVLWGFLRAQVALVSPSCSPDGAFSYVSLGHPRYGPRKQVPWECDFKAGFGHAVLAGSGCAMGAALCLSPLPGCMDRKIKIQTKKI